MKFLWAIFLVIVTLSSYVPPDILENQFTRVKLIELFASTALNRWQILINSSFRCLFTIAITQCFPWLLGWKNQVKLNPSKQWEDGGTGR